METDRRKLSWIWSVFCILKEKCINIRGILHIFEISIDIKLYASINRMWLAFFIRICCIFTKLLWKLLYCLQIQILWFTRAKLHAPSFFTMKLKPYSILFIKLWRVSKYVSVVSRLLSISYKNYFKKYATVVFFFREMYFVDVILNNYFIKYER